MNIALILQIIQILVQNAGAVPELMTLYQEVHDMISGHSTAGTVPTQEILDDLATRVKAAHDKLQVA